MKYKDKYRIPSARAPWWDYGWDAAYFVTICTKNRAHLFGEISEGILHLSPEGQKTLECWQAIPSQFPFATIDAFIIMPNHVHGIVIINSGRDAIHRVSSEENSKNQKESNSKNQKESNSKNQEKSNSKNQTQTSAIHRAPDILGAINRASTEGGITGEDNPMLHRNLSRIIRWYKGRTTFECRKCNPEFGWQTRFYDHIIRDWESLHRIRQYIQENPTNWENDQYHTW